MPTTVLTSNDIDAGTRFTFGSGGDDLIVLRDVTLGSTDGTAVLSDVNNTTTRIDGFAFGSGGAVIDINGRNSFVTVGDTGAVYSFDTFLGSAVVSLAGGGNTVVNNGEISGASAIGIQTSNNNNMVDNRGTIDSQSGVFLGLFGSNNDTLINSGTITANGQSGTVRTGNGVYSEGDNTVIINLAGGSISAFGAQNAGVRIGAGNAHGGDGSVVENHGSIVSARWYGVDFVNLQATNSAELLNFGTISGGAGAFLGNETADVVVNGGLMVGDVSLNTGADIYRASGSGRVEGTVEGQNGNDILRGAAADDVLDGGSGNDVVTGGAGNDVIELGVGEDTGRGGAGDDIVNGGNSGRDQIYGDRGDDVLNAGDDGARVFGGADDDELNGGEGADLLNGGLGEDQLRGNGGNDTMNGGDGSDRLWGGAGADRMNGGNATDTLTGNAGRDVFVFQLFAGDDKITDFQNGKDRIDLSAYNLSGFGAVEARAVAGGVRIDLDAIGGEGSVLIENFSFARLDASDFIF